MTRVRIPVGAYFINTEILVGIMANKRDELEYVLVEEHSTIEADLAQSSADLQLGEDRTTEMANLHNQKHELVSSALGITAGLQSAVHSLLRDLPVKARTRKEKRKEKRIVRPVTKRHVSREEEKEFIERSKRALENLQRNIGELKHELKS